MVALDPSQNMKYPTHISRFCEHNSFSLYVSFEKDKYRSFLSIHLIRNTSYKECNFVKTGMMQIWNLQIMRTDCDTKLCTLIDKDHKSLGMTITGLKELVFIV